MQGVHPGMNSSMLTHQFAFSPSRAYDEKLHISNKFRKRMLNMSTCYTRASHAAGHAANRIANYNPMGMVDQLVEQISKPEAMKYPHCDMPSRGEPLSEG